MNNAHSIINQLIQLQELVSAKMQKKVSMPNARLEELEKSIQALSADLTPAVKTHINRLLQKNPEAVVPVVNGNCAGLWNEFDKEFDSIGGEGRTVDAV